ncbi:MAG: Type II secretion system protein E [candidate division WS2 bacterium]|nr:Type II secretion system protein E [Candidatus Lithacetigena glycinireducens]
MKRRQITKQIGQILVETGKITEEQLNKALEVQKTTGDLLGNILMHMGLVSDKDTTQAYSIQVGIPFVDLETTTIDLDAVRLVPKSLVVNYRLIPIRRENSKLTVAMVNPLNVFAFDDLKFVTGLDIEPMVATETQITSSIDQYYKAGLSLSDTMSDIMSSTDEGVVSADEIRVKIEEGEEEEIGKLKELGEEAPIIRMVNAIVMQAIRDRTSDIHIEPQSRDLRVRYRIDGVLHEVMSPPRRLQSAITSRIKIMANLDIAEKRMPQDGRIMLQVEGKEYDFRVATMPCMFGEKIQIRVLDKSTALLQTNKIGLSQELQKMFEDLVDKPYGMVLATGPTGCGKTTTMYAAVNRLNQPIRNLITIEEPIEYNIPGIAQAQVNVRAGLTFANALRSILRQDPDVIMVGEIRDKETAEIAIHAALTGHMVLSTIHTNDSALTVVRFFHMGVEPFLIASSLIGIVSQRLARRICHKCKESYESSSEVLRKLGLELSSDSITLYRGRGCETCKYTGYYGRTGLFEVMKITDEIREIIVREATALDIRECARRGGMKTLLEDGLEKVLEGTTTIEEAIRVVYVR